MHDKIKKSLARYKELISYATFGLGATLINMLAYWVLADILGIYFMLSNALAWGCAFTFAFVTNKLYVFGSKSFKGKAVVWEVVNFFLARIFTGILDMALMWLLVDFGDMEGLYAKIIANVVVIVVNYLESKFWVFKKKSSS